MSKIPAIISTQRPTFSPGTRVGEVYYEQDTYRLIMWDGQIWHVYSRDSVVYTSGGDDQLHYPQGLFDDTSANYYVGTTPLSHFDSAFPNGVSVLDSDRTKMGWSGYSDEGGIQTGWISRVGSSYAEDSSLSILYDQDKKAFQYNDSGAALSSHPDLDGDFTCFLVQESNSIVGGLSNSSDISSNFMWGGANSILAGSYVGNIQYSQGLSSSGPDLFIVRNHQTLHRLWAMSAIGGASSTGRRIQGYQIYSSPDWGIDRLGDCGDEKFTGYHYEIIVFPTALSQAEMDTVHTYLANKYDGILNHVRNDGTRGVIDASDSDSFSLTSV